MNKDADENQATSGLSVSTGSGFTLSESQLEVGMWQLECTANRWGLTQLQVAKIMSDITYIKECWDWVNMDAFLNSYIYQNKPDRHGDSR